MGYKAKLTQELSQRLGITKKQAKEAVELVFASISEELKSEGKVFIHGFGTFAVRQRAARKARNPLTGQLIEIPPKKAVVFKASGSLKEAVQA